MSGASGIYPLDSVPAPTTTLAVSQDADAPHTRIAPRWRRWYRTNGWLRSQPGQLIAKPLHRTQMRLFDRADGYPQHDGDLGVRKAPFPPER